MGNWTLTVNGTDKQVDLTSAVSQFVNDLNTLGHKITSIRVLTDAGESRVAIPEPTEETNG
jgi:hypothetical protein